MNTYVVYSHRFNKDDGDTRQVDRVQAGSISFAQSDEATNLVIFYDNLGEVTGVVSDFDAVYLESAVLKPHPTGLSPQETFVKNEDGSYT